MQRFEYLTVYINPSGTYQSADGTWKNLQVLGEQGWELVSVVNDSNDLVAFFKRAKDT
jgi:hypothetical protein